MISVLMSTYHEEAYMLKESIESILNQTHKDFELIILLDDPTNDVHKTIIQSYADQDSRIRFYVNETNLGLTATLNKAIPLASGEWIARMDADDIAYPDRFEKQFKYATENDYDLIGGCMQMIDENGKPIYSIQKVPTDYLKIKKCLKYGTCLAHPTWFGKKEVFVSMNGYRNVPYCEDSDFVLRTVLKGYKVSNVQDPVVKYRMTQSSLSRSNLYEQYLYMTQITSAYAQDQVADLDKMKTYVDSHLNEAKSRKYEKANRLFNQMLKELEYKKRLSFIKDGFQLFFTSKEYLNKIYRFMMLSLNS